MHGNYSALKASIGSRLEAWSGLTPASRPGSECLFVESDVAVYSEDVRVRVLFVIAAAACGRVGFEDHTTTAGTADTSTDTGISPYRSWPAHVARCSLQRSSSRRSPFGKPGRSRRRSWVKSPARARHRPVVPLRSISKTSQ